MPIDPNDPGTLDIEEVLAAPSRRLGDPLPGTEQPFVREQSVQSRYLDAAGREIPNPTPLAPPVGYVKRPTIAEQMRQMIRQASYEAANMGAETEEEANDFDVGEDMEPNSPWEHDFDIDPAYEMMLARQSAPPRPEPAQEAPGASAQAPSPTAAAAAVTKGS